MTNSPLDRLLAASSTEWPKDAPRGDLVPAMVSVVQGVADGLLLPSAGERAGVLPVTLGHWVAIAESGNNAFTAWFRLVGQARQRAMLELSSPVESGQTQLWNDAAIERRRRATQQAQSWVASQEKAWRQSVSYIRSLSPRGARPTAEQMAEARRVLPGTVARLLGQS